MARKPTQKTPAGNTAGNEQKGDARDGVEFEFDVAFSFHSRDEALAHELNDLLQDQLETFIYSEQQKLLAGRDGEEIFNAVFERKARVVVIFYRREWGETPFTRIEQTAIRNRAYHHGFEFTLFIPVEKPPTVPAWLPKPRLYFGLERFGLKSAAGVIAQLVQERGGEPRIESVADRAARLQRALDFRKAQEIFRNSPEGVTAALSAYNQVFESLQREASEIASANQHLAGLRASIVAQNRLLSGLGPVVHMEWWGHYSQHTGRNCFQEHFL